MPIIDHVAATSVGVVDGTPLLDLAYDEDSRAEVDMNVVKTGDGRFIEVQGTAEGPPFERQALDDLLELADDGHPRARRRCSARSSATSALIGLQPQDSLLIATTNPGKLQEIAGILAGVPVELVTLSDRSRIAEPEETGATFAENARLKARYYSKATGLVSVADDSGLEIDALDKAPGVHSARWHGTDYPAKFRKIQETVPRAWRHREHRAIRLLGRGGPTATHPVRGDRDGRGRDRRRAARHERIRIRPDLLLSAVRLHAGGARSGARRLRSATEGRRSAQLREYLSTPDSAELQLRDNRLHGDYFPNKNSSACGSLAAHAPSECVAPSSTTTRSRRGAETGATQNGVQLQDIGDRFLLRSGLLRLACADAEVDSARPPFHVRRPSQQVFVADVQRRAFDQQPAEDARLDDRGVQRGDGAVRRSAESRVRRAARDRIVPRDERHHFAGHELRVFAAERLRSRLDCVASSTGRYSRLRRTPP